VREYAPRHFHARREQESRPIDGVEAHNVLSDHVQVGRPVAPEFWALDVRIANGGDVIGERIDPHVHDVLRVGWHFDAPVEGGARDREVLQAALDEARYLVETLLR